MHTSAILFSIIAAAVAWLVGRRDTAFAPRLTAAALALLLAIPVLSLLPKFHILPPVSGTMPAEAAGGPDLWMILWLTGAGICGLRLTLAGLQLVRWRKSSRPVETLALGQRSIEVRTRAGLAGPHACGIFRPLILLPEASTHWPHRVRRMVIDHELAHHRRRDPLWRLIAEVACAIHWFNPLVWWLARHHAIQSEFACDAMVVLNGARADHYAEALCDLAVPSPAMTLAPSLNQASGLEQRVVRLMEPRTHFSPWLATGLAVLVLCIGTAMVLLRPIPGGETPTPTEVHLRHTADPFPANP